MIFCKYAPPQQIIDLSWLSPSLSFDMSYPYLKQGSLSVDPWPFPTVLTMKTAKKKCRSHVQFNLSDIILAQWRHPVASSEAMDHLHQVMSAVTYRHIAMAIETASFVGVFVDCCLFACCPGGRWGDTEWVLARCRRPVASGVALDMLHWVMCFVLHQRTAMAIEMADGGGTCWYHHWFCHRQ